MNGKVLIGMNNDKGEVFFANMDLILFFFSELDIGSSVEVSIDVKECVNITSIEHVVANISYSFHRRGDVKIILISPSGTRSEMLSYRDVDHSDRGLYLIEKIYCI